MHALVLAFNLWVGTETASLEAAYRTRAIYLGTEQARRRFLDVMVRLHHAALAPERPPSRLHYEQLVKNSTEALARERQQQLSEQGLDDRRLEDFLERDRRARRQLPWD